MTDLLAAHVRWAMQGGATGVEAGDVCCSNEGFEADFRPEDPCTDAVMRFVLEQHRNVFARLARPQEAATCDTAQL